MKKTLSLFAFMAFMVISMNSWAQTGADFLIAYKKANINIAFDINAEGTPFRVKWGMDTAWDWDWNVTRGVNYYGKGLFETGRISFQPNDLVTDNGDGTYTLTARQQKELKWRCDLIKRTGTKEVNINCDHEALFANDDYTGRTNYQGKPEEWYKLIKASVQYAQKQGLTVVSVSPFNEPDYVWQQATSETQAMKDFLAIAKLIKADPFFDNIRVCGGNTLNCDRAMPWYNYLKDYIDEGNTHQLAGSFKTYADFFAQVKADGKVATGDEVHNVGEAIVGVQYGMENGIWWGFDSKARGQFMHDSNEGVRLGYGENRSAWTCGAVYRNDQTGEVHGFLGSSERQANNSSYAFISTTKDVFFNGYGPTRMYVYDVPGGTGYQKGQINAERVFDVTWGEDVAPGVIDGVYMVMNASSKKMLTWKGTSNVQSSNLLTSGTSQQWKVYPSYTDGDISYWFIDNVTTSSSKVNLNVLNNNLNANAGVICWDAGHGAVEQWYLKYAKNGYYYIISRLSNKYLYCGSTTSGSNITLADAPSSNATESTLKKYMWRFQPIDSKADVTAPYAPTELYAKQRVASIELNWTAPITTSTVDGAASYTILRGEKNGETTEWSTIGRNDTLTTFLDNTAIAGVPYLYKVIAVDYAGNRSEASDTIEAQLLDEKALICQLQFDKNTLDNTANKMNLSLSDEGKYSTLAAMTKSGEGALNLDGTSYGMLPYSVADYDEMTIATWVRWATMSNWQRVFDFGNNEEQYMFYTPSNGSQMRFVMKNGGDEQILTNSKKLSASIWHHIAITLKPIEDGKVQAILYVDGENVAESNEFTIKPSDIKPSLCFIGRSMFNSDPYFNGRLDDFRIYNYALSAEEIANMMQDTDPLSKDINDSYIETSPTSITSPFIHATTSGRYDLNGRKIKETKGIYIEDGKKFIK